MLEIINNLKPFFEDCYRKISVREYAKLIGISPPTASIILSEYLKEGLLKKEVYRRYHLFYANKESEIFINISKIYWSIKLRELLENINKNLLNSTIILFGSLSKAEVKEDSDIDIAIISRKKELNLKDFEKKLGRKVQLFWFNSLEEIKDDELRKSIINGYVLRGRLSL
jgi:predicted nucleotidyltransferase